MDNTPKCILFCWNFSKGVYEIIVDPSAGMHCKSLDSGTSGPIRCCGAHLELNFILTNTFSQYVKTDALLKSAPIAFYL